MLNDPKVVEALEEEEEFNEMVVRETQWLVGGAKWDSIAYDNGTTFERLICIVY